MAHSSTRSSDSRVLAPSRRVLVSAAAWAAPVAVVTGAAPAIAASCDATTVFAPVSTGTATSVTLETSLPGVTVTISTQLGANTVVEQQGQSFNFSQEGDGWNGNRNGEASERVFRGFSPLGAIVLNQRSATQGDSPIGSPLQTVSFIVHRNGTPVEISAASVDIFDISSGKNVTGATPWRSTYRDAVGFDQTPAITTLTTPSSGDLGEGAGTFDDPFRRVGDSRPTSSGPYEERFQFDSIPATGLKMQYSNYPDLSGWEFVAISGFSFSLC